MVLCIEGRKKFFDPQLLKLLTDKKSTEVIDILQSYSTNEFSLELNQLRDSSQATLLHYAAESGDAAVVQYLLDSNFVVDVQDCQGRSPLMLTVAHGHENVVQILLKNPTIHLSDGQDKTIFQMIFENKTKQFVLLKTLFQNTTWQQIIEVITPNYLVEKLVEARYTLKDALEWGSAELVKFWLKRDNVIDICDEMSGKTLLHQMIENKMMKMAKVLIECGANVDALDHKEATPMYYVSHVGTKNQSEYIELLKVLVSRSSSLTTSTIYGNMQISTILENGSAEGIEIILRAVIDLNTADQQGNTLLHYLAKNGIVDLSKLMRGRTFQVNARNNIGSTPLHVAATRKSFKVMKFLLENGADINEANNAKKTCLYLIFDFNRLLAIRDIELLVQNGADPQECLIYLTTFDWILLNSRRGNIGYLPVLFDDFTKIFAKAEPILQRLAVVQGLGTEITETTRSKINMQQSWVDYFDKCRGQVQKMKETTVYGNVTLFKFLTESNAKLTSYVRNEELVSELENAIEDFDFASPYPELLRSRLAKAVQLLKLKEKVIAAICRLINLQNNLIHYFAAEYIVDYLSMRDMENLLLVWND